MSVLSTGEACMGAAAFVCPEQRSGQVFRDDRPFISLRRGQRSVASPGSESALTNGLSALMVASERQSGVRRENRRAARTAACRVGPLLNLCPASAWRHCGDESAEIREETRQRERVSYPRPAGDALFYLFVFHLVV
ncbi:hypothetical protein MRX96_002431 [Rhipicephalus microplus]